MGTNFYARIIPKQEDKQKLIEAINKDQFDVITNLSRKIYSDSDSYDVNGIIHLGKRSGGWKFLWNPNVRRHIVGRIDETKEYHKDNIKWEYEYLYPLTKQGISDFLHRDDVVIVSEYYNDEDPIYNGDEDKLTADEFLEMAFNWGKEDGWDSNGYKKYQIEKGKRYYDYSNSERDEMWESLGYKVNNGCDFYSDGLRFSTSLEFS